MGSPEKLYPHSRLRRLSSAQKKRLHARIKQELKKNPMARQIISAHKAMTKELIKKLPKI
jgi:hypothetical protein